VPRAPGSFQVTCRGRRVVCGWPYDMLFLLVVESRASSTPLGMPENLPVSWLAEHCGHFRILWPGLLANTLFFSLLFLIPVYGGLIVHSQVRQMRGRCPCCAYPVVSGQGGCPECGWGRTAA
jgi:hypothetical protein